MHFPSFLLLLGGAATTATLATAATTPHYFTLSTINSNTPSGLTTPSNDTITFPLSDSSTKLATSCTLSWDWSKKPPTTYTTCKNTAYHVKLEKYTDLTDFVLDIKHVYDSKTGKTCTGGKKGCVTTVGEVNVTKSGAAFKSYCGSSGACGAVSTKGAKGVVSSSTTGTE